VAEYVSSRILSLPMSAALTEDQASYVATTLKSILKRNN
jgi:dTDP-4-amino-4,6-dideoxygalactose transaminase